eukprot:scaffold4_cov396-Prasinococcus_capsulatus_cf.AAC.18
MSHDATDAQERLRSPQPGRYGSNEVGQTLQHGQGGRESYACGKHMEPHTTARDSAWASPLHGFARVTQCRIRGIPSGPMRALTLAARGRIGSFGIWQLRFRFPMASESAPAARSWCRTRDEVPPAAVRLRLVWRPCSSQGPAECDLQRQLRLANEHASRCQH